MAGGAALLRGNALRLPLADHSVDLVVTSPPYWSMRAYIDAGLRLAGQLGLEPTPDDFLVAQWAVMDELHRVLKPDGVCWVNMGDKRAGSGGHNNAGIHASKPVTKYRMTGDERQSTRRQAPDRYLQANDAPRKSKLLLPARFALGCTQPHRHRFGPAGPCWHDDDPCTVCRPGWPVWGMGQDQVWSKPNHLPDNIRDRTQDAHEYWFMFTKGGPDFYAAVDEIREPHAAKTLTHRGGGQAHGNHANPDNNYGSDKPRRPDPLGTVPGSVWSIPSEPLVTPAFFVVTDGRTGQAIMDKLPRADADTEAARHGYKNAWRWVESTGVDRSPWPRPTGDHPPMLTTAPDHFAAFPQEWPRRLILGWSPNGICEACNQGRRPVPDREFERTQATHRGGRTARNPDNRRDSAANRLGTGRYQVQIMGYSCACPDDSAPTRPAVVLDPFVGTGTVPMVARMLGRFGVGVDLSASYLQLAWWRTWRSGHASKTLKRTNEAAQEAML